MSLKASERTLERLEGISARQRAYEDRTLSLLASASLSSPIVRSFSSTVLSNITTEGYPGARYHPGSRFADEVESIANSEAMGAFRCSYANVQPHSASSANASIMIELLRPGARIMGMGLASGGHLTHGSQASFSGKLFEATPYGLTNGLIDYDQVRDLAIKNRPELIICGASSYPRQLCFESFARIADEVGATLLADISHISGLVVAGLHPSPIDHAHIVTTSTYKQLAGPRGGLIVSNHSRLPGSSASLGQRLNRAVFPLTQGTPDLANIAAKAAALSMARTKPFRRCMKSVINLASHLATALSDKGFELVTGGTDTHMVLIDIRDRHMTGKEAEYTLEAIGILANRNVIPGDPQPPSEASGLRLGTNILAIRGFTRDGVTELVDILGDALDKGPNLKKKRRKKLRDRVRSLCEAFPIPEQG